MSTSLHMKMGIRPELELVLCAAYPENPENLAQAVLLLGDELNWSDVLACAIQHRLEAALSDLLRTLDTGRLKASTRATLADFARNSARNGFILLSEMLRLHGLFEAAGIPAIPFKGPALAWLAYPNFARRTYVDLDFVVPQRFIPEATTLLQAQNYAPQFDASETLAGEHGPAPGQYAFAWSARKIHLELHTERTLRYFARPLNLEEMHSRLFTLNIGGRTVRTFSVEDLLAMLCVHGAKHFWERLAWIVDIKQLVTARPVNWQLLFEISESMESTRVLLLGLHLAHELLDAPLPSAVVERAASDARVRWLAGKVFDQLTSKSDSSVGVLRRAAFRLQSSDGYWQGLRHVIRLSTRPTELDRGTISLPGVLSPAYALLRPFRLVREYGLGLRGRAKPDLAIYEPTPQEIVEQMLRLAEISPGDVLYDLGCGDGRIVVTAAKKYGIRAVGVDINPRRIAEARANARRQGVQKLTEFILGDAKKEDVGEASVVTMFLGADANLRLADRLRQQLCCGSRVVSRNFQIYGWVPDHSEEHILPSGALTSLYLWRVKNAPQEPPEDTSAAPGTPQSLRADSLPEETDAPAPVPQRER